MYRVPAASRCDSARHRGIRARPDQNPCLLRRLSEPQHRPDLQADWYDKTQNFQRAVAKGDGKFEDLINAFFKGLTEPYTECLVTR